MVGAARWPIVPEASRENRQGDSLARQSIVLPGWRADERRLRHRADGLWLRLAGGRGEIRHARHRRRFQLSAEASSPGRRMNHGRARGYRVYCA